MGGIVAEEFEGVAAAFERNFTERGDVGAAVAVEIDGRVVVDLWDGHRDADRRRVWDERTIVGTFSVTKGVTAICLNRLIGEGRLDPDEPVATYWPEFAAAGKEKIPVRWALSHQAGLAAIDADLAYEDIFDWDRVVAAIAAQEPNWEPGTQHGYHSRSFGWIAGEIIRRVTGRSMGTYLREQIGDPYGIDYWVGLPAELDVRCADLIADPDARFVEITEPKSLVERVMVGPGRAFQKLYDDETWNRREIRAAEMPSSNGHGSAAALARLYTASFSDAHGPRLVSADALAAATEVQAEGTDAVIGMPMTFGLGFMLGSSFAPAAGESAYGHAGAGGSLAFADPHEGLSFAYVMNQLRLDGMNDRRAYSLVRAVYAALEAA